MTAPRLVELPVDRLHVDAVNPRVDAGDVDDLLESIRSTGILTPLLVRPSGDGQWGILSGQRRWTAAGKLGLDVVPCIVRDDLDDLEALAIATAENEGREGMPPLDTARAFDRLRAAGLTQEQIAARTGCSQFKVSQYLQVLEGPDDVVAAVESGSMSLSAGYTEIKARRRAAKAGKPHTPPPTRRRAPHHTPDPHHVAPPNGFAPVLVPERLLEGLQRAALELGIRRNDALALRVGPKDELAGRILAAALRKLEGGRP